MIAEPYASPAELATYMQTIFDDVETASAGMLLGFVALLIRTEYPGIDSRDPVIDPELPKLVSLELVSRKMERTSSRGATSITDSMDDITTTTQFAGGPQPFGGLEIDDWADRLLSSTPSTGPRAFGIRMSSYGANQP